MSAAAGPTLSGKSDVGRVSFVVTTGSSQPGGGAFADEVAFELG
jgi:hypothetical protein